MAHLFERLQDFLEPLLETLLDLQSTSPSFRQLFKSQQITSSFINTYSKFVVDGDTHYTDRGAYIRILEKLNHFALALTLDNAISSTQKQQVCTFIHYACLPHVFLRNLIKITLTFHKAEAILNDQYDGNAENSSSANAIHVTNGVSHSGVQLVHERTYQRMTAKIREWRKSTAANERKRFAQTLSDMCVISKLLQVNCIYSVQS